jgi:hypothetical protein
MPLNWSGPTERAGLSAAMGASSIAASIPENGGMSLMIAWHGERRDIRHTTICSTILVSFRRPRALLAHEFRYPQAKRALRVPYDCRGCE